MQKYIFIFTIIILQALGYSQKLPENFRKVFWSDDFVVNDHDISGKFYAVQKSSGHIIVGIIDSLTVPSEGMRIMASTDLGVTWFGYAAVLERYDFREIKMIISSTDSIYCFYLIGNEVFCWNIDAGVRLTGILDAVSYDVLITPSQAIYLFVENTAQILSYYSSTDYGLTWNGPTEIDPGGVNPKVSEIGTSGYFTITYFSDLTTPVVYSKIFTQSGSEYAPGILTLIPKREITAGGVFISEFDNAYLGDKIWILYAIRNSENIDIFGKYSLDNGTNFSDALPIAIDPVIQEYNVSVAANSELNGFDMIFYSDSVDLTQLTNETDKLIYSYDGAGSEDFLSRTQISQHPPYWSPTEYSPKLVPLPFSPGFSEVGAMWMGYDNGTNKLFFDSYFAITDACEQNPEVISEFRLFDNYPNPFNPETVVKYQIPVVCEVSLKVFDILGNEVASLVNQSQNPGEYQVTWYAPDFPSGIYFCKLNAGNFSAIQKIVLVK